MVSFPTSLDALTNPVSTDQLSAATVPHATQHANANDILEALEAKVGTGSSTPATVGHVLTVTGTGASAWQGGGRGAPLVTSVTDSATPTPNVDTTDLYDLTALAQAATFGAPTGTPVNGQKLIIRIKDNGTARALAWNAAYVAGGVALPTTTTLSKITHVGFIYNTANALNKWLCVAALTEA